MEPVSYTHLLQSCGQSLSVLHDLAGILLELRLEGLAEADGLGGDDVLQRAALGCLLYTSGGPPNARGNHHGGNRQ